jgi:excisionase family DNA binding protein
MENDNLMTLKDLSDYLKVRKRTIYGWLKKGKVPAIRAVGQWRFKKGDIDSWLRKAK